MSTIVSLDLDDLACYHAIHGLDAPDPAPDSEAARLALERWLPRFLDLFQLVGVTSTIFVIGRDLERDLSVGGRGAEHLVRALREGHELANHSYAHAYDLHRWPARDLARDLRRCDSLLHELGAYPRGFRAPGYTHDRDMLMQVGALGYAYDSSMLPSPSYYAAKLGIIGLRRLRRRRSASQVDGARAFVGPSTVHYLPEHGLWELPISVSRTLRLTMTGTLLQGDAPPMMSKLRGEALRQEAAEMAHLHLELHAIDLADMEADNLAPELVAHQRELATPLDRRLERLAVLLRARKGGVSIARAMARHL